MTEREDNKNMHCYKLEKRRDLAVIIVRPDSGKQRITEKQEENVT